MAANNINRWMVDAVALTPDGSLLVGEYDGYGNLNGRPISIDADDPSVWHKSCWEQASRPSKYTGPSEYAPDQGWFFDDPEHDMSQPVSDTHG